jgi:hypothetical protein
MFPNGGPYADSLPLPEPSFTALEFLNKNSPNKYSTIYILSKGPV